MKSLACLVSIIAVLVSCSSRHNNSLPENETDHLLEKGRWVSIKDANGENGYCLFENKIYGLDLGLRETADLNRRIRELQPLYPLYGSDAETFEVCINSDYEPYGRDAHNVYYHDLSSTEFFDGEEVGGEIYRGDLSIKGADPKTFKYLGDGYAVDKRNMYHEGKTIAWDGGIINLLQIKLEATALCETEGFADLLDSDLKNTTVAARIAKILRDETTEEPLSDVDDYVSLLNFLRKPGTEKYDDKIGKFLYQTFSDNPLKLSQVDVYMAELPDIDRIPAVYRLVDLLGQPFYNQYYDKGYSNADLERLFFTKFPIPYKKESLYSLAYNRLRVKMNKQRNL